MLTEYNGKPMLIDSILWL
jgi:hypothetical protein